MALQPKMLRRWADENELSVPSNGAMALQHKSYQDARQELQAFSPL